MAQLATTERHKDSGPSAAFRESIAPVEITPVTPVGPRQKYLLMGSNEGGHLEPDWFEDEIEGPVLGPARNESEFQLLEQGLKEIFAKAEQRRSQLVGGVTEFGMQIYDVWLRTDPVEMQQHCVEYLNYVVSKRSAFDPDVMHNVLTGLRPAGKIRICAQLLDIVDTKSREQIFELLIGPSESLACEIVKNTTIGLANLEMILQRVTQDEGAAILSGLGGAIPAAHKLVVAEALKNKNLSCIDLCEAVVAGAGDLNAIDFAVDVLIANTERDYSDLFGDRGPWKADCFGLNVIKMPCSRYSLNLIGPA